MDFIIHEIYFWQIYLFRNKYENTGSEVFLVQMNFLFLNTNLVLKVIAVNKTFKMKKKQ